MKVVLVVGLPASGKTSYIQNRRAGEIGTSQVLDDPRRPEEVTAAIEAAVQQALTTLFISDPWLCLLSARQQAAAQLAEHDLEWVFFENNAAACADNAYRRGHRDVLGLIQQLSRQYQVPEGAAVVPVYRPSP